MLFPFRNCRFASHNPQTCFRNYRFALHLQQPIEHALNLFGIADLPATCDYHPSCYALLEITDLQVTAIKPALPHIEIVILPYTCNTHRACSHSFEIDVLPAICNNHPSCDSPYRNYIFASHNHQIFSPLRNYLSALHLQQPLNLLYLFIEIADWYATCHNHPKLLFTYRNCTFASHNHQTCPHPLEKFPICFTHATTIEHALPCLR